MEAPAHTWQQYSIQAIKSSFKEIQSNLRRKKLHRTNSGSNFLGDSSQNSNNVRAPIQFRRESQPRHPKRWFFLKNRPLHFHINRTSVTRLVKWNQFSQHWDQQATYPSPQFLADQIQVRKPIQIVTTDQMPDHT